MKKKMISLCLVMLMALGMFSGSANATGAVDKGEWTWGSKTIHYMKTTPDRLRLTTLFDTIDKCTYDNAINASYFNMNNFNATSMAIENNQPVAAGSEANHIEEKTIRAAFVYDKKAEEMSIQRGVQTKDDVVVLRRTSYMAVGGVEWNGIMNGSGSSTQRTALVYDKKGYVYLIATADGFTQEQWEEAIETRLGKTNGEKNFADGIHLDGGGSTQMRYDDEVVVESSKDRAVPIIIRAF